MKAYLIDPWTLSISEVDYSGDYKQIYTFIKADLFDVVGINQNGDCIYVDDEGLLKDPDHWILLEGYDQPLAGRGLVLGTDDEGKSVDPTITLQALASRIYVGSPGTGWVRPFVRAHVA